jgi:Tfp pilus assembly protein PilX
MMKKGVKTLKEVINMSYKHWMPDREQDFYELSQTWNKYITDQQWYAGFGWDEAEIEPVVMAIQAFALARRNYLDDKTSSKRKDKDIAMKAAKTKIREFYEANIRFNKKIPLEKKRLLGWNDPDTEPTDRPVPAGQPVTMVENTTNHFEHKLKAVNAEGSTRKPADAYGVRYAWQVGGKKPATGADLPKGKSSRKTTYIVSYTEAEKGQTVWYATCYENQKGDQGTWSPVVDAVIG